MNTVTEFCKDLFPWHDVQAILLLAILIIFLIMAIIDVFFNKSHTVRHNFPLVGRLRYLLERIGPELRQYIVANNREELPFNRSQRSWIYASSKRQNNYESFGTDKDLFGPGHIFLRHAMFPFSIKEGHPNYIEKDFLPCAKAIGAFNRRRKPFRPCSVVNISAMSYGSLSANAVTALNKGALKAGCYHNTGEGSCSPYHSFGADVVLQIGTAYFGVRDAEGNFSFEKLEALLKAKPMIKAIEIKLSQGAKPGKGGVLPADKITEEIAGIRGVPRGEDVVSPPSHSAFSDLPGLIGFIEELADKSGLPVGIKSAVGQMEVWNGLAEIMKETGRGPDFITIDGGEGGTGAAPPSFADHVSIPFVHAFSNVYKIFLAKGLTERIVFIASGRLGLPAYALMAFSMGADLINVAREAMMSIGCIQAQKCHTNTCPTGIATHNRWLTAGLDPELKADRYCSYVKTLRKEMLEITHACGHEHPCQMSMEDVELSAADINMNRSLKQVFGYDKSAVPFDGMEVLAECRHLGGEESRKLPVAAA